MANVGLVPHSHCKRCEEPITEGEEYCSDECKMNYESEKKKSSRNENMFFIGAAAVVIVLSIVFYVL